MMAGPSRRKKANVHPHCTQRKKTHGMKRGLHGVYRHTSEKHVHRYVNEFTFHLNGGDVKRRTLEWLASLVSASFGQRISYKDLTA